MRKLIGLSLLVAGFMLATPQVTAQNAEQQISWNNAKAQTEFLAETAELTDNQKAMLERHLYNYQERVKALDQNIEHFPFQSEAEVSQRLDEEVEEVLDGGQYAVYKNKKAELLEKRASN
ncbi:MAG TPA: hypothetical protein VK021_00695 [Flavobacteriaceae bacterium]|nr:hypothetical protein [Flavobacteriaceae bacterium]